MKPVRITRGSENPSTLWLRVQGIAISGAQLACREVLLALDQVGCFWRKRRLALSLIHCPMPFLEFTALDARNSGDEVIRRLAR